VDFRIGTEIISSLMPLIVSRRNLVDEEQSIDEVVAEERHKVLRSE
jgi:hypothetical protein